jgi:hypothetical protein
MEPKELKPIWPSPELTPEQEAAIAAIEIMPFRPENASGSMVTSHVIDLNGEPIRIHEVNNFPGVFLRKYFSYVNRERRNLGVNLKKEIGPWMPVMDLLIQKAPDLYAAIARYDRAMMEINQARYVYSEHILKADTSGAKEIAREMFQAGMQRLNAEIWPTDHDIALRDIEWSMAYDTICEIAKVIAPHLNRQTITEEANMATKEPRS